MTGGTTVRRVLLVDDDAVLRQSLAEQLRLHEEFKTEEVETGQDCLERIEESRFNAVILDSSLPDMEGRALCALLRRRGLGVPILILAPAGFDAEAVLGPDVGASEVVIKPFRLSDLLARLRGALRQFEQSGGTALTIGRYSFYPAEKLLIEVESGRRVRLTEKEAAILTFLHQAGARIIDRETLLGKVWGYNAGVTTHTLETHVYRLRQKIEDDPAKAVLLVTEPGGYRLALEPR